MHAILPFRIFKPPSQEICIESQCSGPEAGLWDHLRSFMSILPRASEPGRRRWGVGWRASPLPDLYLKVPVSLAQHGLDVSLPEERALMWWLNHPGAGLFCCAPIPLLFCSLLMNSVTQRQPLPPQASSHSSQSPRCPCDGTQLSPPRLIPYQSELSGQLGPECSVSHPLCWPTQGPQNTPQVHTIYRGLHIHRIAPHGNFTCKVCGFNKASWLPNIQPPLHQAQCELPGWNMAVFYTHAIKNRSTGVENYYIERSMTKAQDSNTPCILNDMPRWAFKYLRCVVYC